MGEIINILPCSGCAAWTYKRTVPIAGCEADTELRYGWCSQHGIEMTDSVAPGCEDHSERVR